MSLQILGKRKDGFHEVRTVLQTISLHDDLRFEITDNEGVTLTCNVPEIPTGDRNLIIRAAQTLQRGFAPGAGANVHLQKRIPAQAGLGGASSNAAVALLALNKLWDVRASISDLQKLGSEIGSDVPFFFLGGTTLATGSGSTVSPLPDEEKRYLIVITPNVGVSTAKAYETYSSRNLTSSNSEPILASSREAVNLHDSNPWAAQTALQNDFESVIFDIEPEIRRAREHLLQAGATQVLLAGSGSSVFGVFADAGAQQNAVKKNPGEAGWRIFSCVTVSRGEYLSALGSCGI